MIFTYTPEGAIPREWTFTPDKLLTVEAEAIEKVTGSTYEEFGQSLLRGSVTARRALLWVLLKRDTPTLAHRSVDVSVGSMALDFETHELLAMREALEQNRDISEEDRADALAALDELMAGETPEAPKAPGSDDDTTT